MSDRPRGTCYADRAWQGTVRIQENVPRQGRVLFAGPAVHAYGAGHVAPLPLFTDREMMACDFYHFSPKQVEYVYPPSAYRQTPESVFDFMEQFKKFQSMGMGMGGPGASQVPPGMAGMAMAPFQMWMQAAEMWQRNMASAMSMWSNNLNDKK